MFTVNTHMESDDSRFGKNNVIKLRESVLCDSCSCLIPKTSELGVKLSKTCILCRV